MLGVLAGAVGEALDVRVSWRPPRGVHPGVPPPAPVAPRPDVQGVTGPGAAAPSSPRSPRTLEARRAGLHGLPGATSTPSARHSGARHWRGWGGGSRGQPGPSGTGGRRSPPPFHPPHYSPPPPLALQSLRPALDPSPSGPPNLSEGLLRASIRRRLTPTPLDLPRLDPPTTASHRGLTGPRLKLQTTPPSDPSSGHGAHPKSTWHCAPRPHPRVSEMGVENL